MGWSPETKAAPISTRLAVRPRLTRSAVVVAVLALLALLVLPMLPAQAAGWPSVFHAYGRFDGATFNDPLDQPAGNAIADLSSGVTTTASGPHSSVYVAADGTDLLVRFRLKETPGSATGANGWDTSKGGVTGNAYVVQLSVNGTHVASVGLDGKPAATDYVYVAPVNDVTAGATTYTSTNPRVVSAWNGTSIPNARISNAGNASAPAETFLDFRVPISDISLVAPSITATTPVQFFFGTSAAANLTTINKDYMSNAGETCAIIGCATVLISPASLGLEWTNTPAHVSGPNPPSVGQTSVYDLTVKATNDGLNPLTAISITDALPSYLQLLSASTTSGTATTTGGDLTWQPDDLGPGEQATVTLRVSAAPQWNGELVLSNGPSGEGTDATAGTTSTASLPAVSVSAVGGAPRPSEPPTEPATESPTDPPTELTTETPTDIPTDPPTGEPTDVPTEAVTDEPTEPATEAPTAEPTADPTDPPTDAPTEAVTEAPTDQPTADPTDAPTESVTDEPTEEPTEDPTDPPTESVTDEPTDEPPPDPTDQPTEDPTEDPEPPPAPIAADDYAGGRTGEVVTVPVLDNDEAPSSALDPASVTLVEPLAHGTVLAIDATTGDITYQPDAAYEGDDEFVYSVCNLHGVCDVATVFTATPPVDLAVEIDRTGPSLAVGDRATYDVTVTNLGPRFAEGPLTLTLSAPTGLGDLEAAGTSWMPIASPALSALGASTPAAGAETVSLDLPDGLAVGAPSLVVLSGTVTGVSGSEIRVDAQVSGISIELVYANNESSATDVVTGVDDPDVTDPDDRGPDVNIDGDDDTTGPDRDTSDDVDRTDDQRSTGTSPPPGQPTSPAIPGTNRTLAATGAMALPMLTGGLGAAGLGVSLLRATRRRRRLTGWGS